MNKRSFKAKVLKARNLTKEIEQLKHEIFGDASFGDVPFDGTNSDNLQDTINCFIDYGEGVMSAPIDNDDAIVDALWIGYQKHL